MTNPYDDAFAKSINDPDAFWAEAAEDCHWYKKWDKVLDDSNKPFYRWFTGGEINTCYNALDLHIENGRGDQLALIYDSPVTNTVKKYTYNELRDEVAKFAGATRINDAKPKVIVSASCGIEVKRVIAYKPLLDEAIEMADANNRPAKCVILQRPMETAGMIEGRDIDWTSAMADAQPHDCVPLAATDPLYILYTSGTTGEPKGVVRDNGGHVVALKWTMKNVYNVDAGDVYWAASDVGWVVGHSYIIYGPLLKGCTTIVFEGKPVGTPDAGAFWRVIADHKVKTMFTAPTAFRAIKRDDPKAEMLKKYDLSNFKTLFLAGERLDPDTLHWAEDNLNIPVIDHWWQTETGWAICANCMGIEHLKIKEGSPTKPAPGWNVKVVDESNNLVEPGKIGALVVKLPLPPGSLPTLWNADKRYIESYLEEFPGYYKTADAGFIDEDGYVFVMSRTDDIINVAGHRLSTGAMEEILADHPDVAECAVLGVDDQLKGQIPVGFLVLNAGVDRDNDDIIKEVIQSVRDRIGPVASFKTATVVKRLPKTRSGKILRGTIQKIADNKDYKVPATIDDPAILGEMEEALIGIGFAKARK